MATWFKKRDYKKFYEFNALKKNTIFTENCKSDKIEGNLVKLILVMEEKAANNLEFVYYGDKRLFEKAIPVDQKDIKSERIQKLIHDMKDYVMEKNGAGLAHNQVRYPGEKYPPLRIFITLYFFLLDDDSEEDPLFTIKSENKELRLSADMLTFINPVIIKSSKETKLYKNEGCLSIPGVFMEIERPREVTIRAFDESGNLFEQTAYDGNESWEINAEALQHELNHLDGILFVNKGEITPEIANQLKDLETIHAGN